MYNSLKLHFLRNKPLIIALIISLLLHSTLLKEFTLPLPIENRIQALEINLVNLPPTQKLTLVPIAKPGSQSYSDQNLERKPQVTQTKATQVSKNTSSIVEQPATQQIPPTEALQDKVISEQVHNKPTPSNAIVQDDILVAPKPPAYHYVGTEFEVRRGTDSNPIGTSYITFSIDNNGNYQINSMTEVKDLASLSNKLKLESKGRVTEQGLVPSYFSHQYNEEEIQSASFAWGDKVLLMHGAEGDKTENLEIGTQDLLSAMYQFMFSHPLKTLQMTVTNGENLRIFSYIFQGEEIISTKFGELKTVHLLKNGNGNEKTELWLAIDYQYLPVMVRDTEQDGTVIEQIARNIVTNPQ